MSASRPSRTAAAVLLSIALVGVGVSVAAGAFSGGSPEGERTSASSASEREPVTVLSPSKPRSITIERLGLATALVPLATDARRMLELPPTGGVGWDANSVTPGQAGVSVVTGYIRRTPQEAGAFVGLEKLGPGDHVVVEREDGRAVDFVVTRITSYPRGGFSPGEVYTSRGVPELRIVTTGGALPGQPEGNVVVFATATSTGK